MAYTLGNKCAKKCCKPTILVQLIVENVVIFLRHSVYALYEYACVCGWQNPMDSLLALTYIGSAKVLAGNAN